MVFMQRDDEEADREVDAKVGARPMKEDWNAFAVIKDDAVTKIAAADNFTIFLVSFKIHDL